MPELEIDCRGLTKRFGDFVAVRDVSFQVSKGEVFGFLGPNGCGKSTTIRMICGLLTPSSGTAVVRGTDVTEDPDRVKGLIGYMSQKFSLYDDLNVIENLQFFGGIYGLHGRTRQNRIDEILEVVGLAENRRDLVADLSSGIRQRLALAASILHAPEILILDEPTSGVDPLSRRRFWDLINDLASSGSTILVTTHAMDEAEHCHRIAMMQSGQLVCVGTPEELRTNRVKGQIWSMDAQPLFSALAIAQNLPNVNDASVFGSKLHIQLAPGIPNPDAAVSALKSRGFKIGEIGLAVPTLEDVFVSVAMEAAS